MTTKRLNGIFAEFIGNFLLILLGPCIMHALLPMGNKRDSQCTCSMMPVAGPFMGAAIAALLYLLHGILIYRSGLLVPEYFGRIGSGNSQGMVKYGEDGHHNGHQGGHYEYFGLQFDPVGEFTKPPSRYEPDGWKGNDKCNNNEEREITDHHQ